jgi:CRP/FNR family transcriptional regulator, cyclic AMP receptor protein
MAEQKGGRRELDSRSAAVSMPASLTRSEFRIRYDPGQVIYRQGDPCDAVYYIEEGSVQISVMSVQGKEGVIASLGATDFFGEECLAHPPAHLSTATAMSQCAVIKIGKDRMLNALQQAPAFAEHFISFLLSRNAQIQDDLIDQLFNSSEKRLARTLLLLANFGGETDLVIPKVSQESLAARIGTNRSRVNYFMNKFRRLGFIEYQGRELRVHSSLVKVLVQESSRETEKSAVRKQGQRKRRSAE